jgi:hypothetical protein
MSILRGGARRGAKDRRGAWPRLALVTAALAALAAALWPGAAAAGSFGAVEVCKAPGADVAGKRFAFSVGGREVTVTASASQTMCSPAVEVAAGTVTVTEAAASGFEATAVTTVPQAALVGSPDLAARRATVRVEAGEDTLVVFTNAAVSKPPPPPPPPHVVKLCKTGDVDAKASFSFAVTRGGTAVQGSPFTLSTGACTLVGTFPVGTELTVVETPAHGTAVARVAASPAAFLASAEGATANVRVVQTRSTVNVLTFENRRAGTSPDTGKQVPVKLCKAGKVPSGTSFAFAVSAGGAAVPGSPFTLTAGRCVLVGAFPAGTVLSITEGPAPGTELAGVAAWPSGALLSVSDRTATVRVTASHAVSEDGAARKAKPSFHALVGHVLGTLGKHVRVVSAKTGKGTKAWKLHAQAGKRSKASWKGKARHGTRALAWKRKAWKGWHRGDDAYRHKGWWKGATVVWFHNRGVKPTPPPPHAKTYPLKVCKAGPVDPTASFSFAVSGGASGSFTLRSGECRLVGSFPQGTTLQVAETPASGTVLKEVLGSPSGVVVGVQGTTATVTVAAAEVNRVVFVNKAQKTPPPPPPPPSGACTYTKGFYKSAKGARLIDEVAAAGLALPAETTVDGSTTDTLANAQVHAVFDTSQSELAPGTGAAFNLLQQTVAALLNVERGATASASVQAAIAAALGGLAFEVEGGAVTAVTATAAARAAHDVIEGFNASPATHCR